MIGVWATSHWIRRGGHVLPKPVPPTCRGVGAVGPRPAVWGGAPSVDPQHNHAKSALRGKCAPWMVGRYKWCDMRAGCMLLYLHAVATNFRSPCRRPVTVLVRLVIGRRRGQERAPRQPCIGPQHSHAKSALCGACSVGDRSILHGASCALAARHRIRRSGHVLPKPAPPTCHGVGAVDPRPSAWGSAPRVGSQHNHAKSALRGKRAPWMVDQYSEPRLAAWGRARHALAHNTTTPSPHCAARSPQAVDRYSMVRYACGPRGA